MNDVSGHKNDDSDDGRVLDFKYIGEEENEVVSESDGNTGKLIVEMWAFLSFFFFFPAPPQLCSS